jgi:hypothetical protein
MLLYVVISIKPIFFITNILFLPVYIHTFIYYSLTIGCPSVLGTDCIGALVGLKALLKPAGIKAAYFPPPSKEEEAYGLKGTYIVHSA